MSDAKAAGHFVASKAAVGVFYVLTVAVSARVYDTAGYNYVSAITLLHLGDLLVVMETATAGRPRRLHRCQ